MVICCLNLQPGLSGALFAGAKRRQKSGNGGRKKLPEKIKAESYTLPASKYFENYYSFTLSR